MESVISNHVLVTVRLAINNNYRKTWATGLGGHLPFSGHFSLYLYRFHV